MHRLSPRLLLIFASALICPAPNSRAQVREAGPLAAEIDRAVEGVMDKVIAWRRDIHEHPELSNREFRTAGIVAEHLRSLGLEVRTEVAHTGVVGVLKGGRPGPVVALRADMDALPVVEQVDLPFASKVRTDYLGQDVGVMHACGHDTHVAILMGAAEVLAGMQERIPGTIKFIFQPAEEGAPPGEGGGAGMMIRQGVLENPEPEAIIGLHITSRWAAGEVAFRPRGALAGADGLRITVKGRQTHAAQPWAGIDPIVIASQIVMGLQTIASRQIDVTKAPAIISIGRINGGVRGNIIPDEVELWGTIRTFDPKMRLEIHERVRRTAERIAESAGATAEVVISDGTPVTFNDPELTKRMAPTLRRVVGEENVLPSPMVTGAEDFAFYQQRVPGFFFFIGGRPKDMPLEEAAPNHSPLFYVDESSLPAGVRLMTHLAVDYLSGPPD